MRYVETHITQSCNLNCKGCSHFSSLAKPKHKDLEEFRKEFQRLSEIMDIDIIRLMGGEPLLNHAFMEYARIARGYFPGSNISIVTNGILLDRVNTEQLKEYNIGVTVSDYHIGQSWERMEDRSQMLNISLDLAGGHDREEMYRRCDTFRWKCAYLKDGRMYTCATCGEIGTFWEYFHIKPWFEDQGIDIFKHTAAEIEDHVYSSCELCEYCNVDKRTYSPFEISKKDIREWTCQ